MEVDKMDKKKSALVLLAIISVIAVSLFQGDKGIRINSQVCIYKNGQLIDCKHNVITNAGKNATRDRLGTPGSLNAFQYLALGNGTAPTATDTSLNSEITNCGLARALSTVYVLTTTGNWTLSKTWTFTCSTAVPVNTTAIFNDTASGIMFAGTSFTTATLSTSGDQLTINYTIWIS
jgi:hypothetical protein